MTNMVAVAFVRLNLVAIPMSTFNRLVAQVHLTLVETIRDQTLNVEPNLGM